MGDDDVARRPKHAARKLKELSWESITQTEDLKRRGGRRGRFGGRESGRPSCKKV